MTWGGGALGNALKSKGIPKEFDEWFAIAKDRPKWRQQGHSKLKSPDASWLKDTSRVNNYNCFKQQDIRLNQTCFGAYTFSVAICLFVFGEY